jgi:hypothetical protein
VPGREAFLRRRRRAPPEVPLTVLPLLGELTASHRARIFFVDTSAPRGGRRARASAEVGQ